MGPMMASNGTISGATYPVIQVYAPATAYLNTDLLELSGVFAFYEISNGQSVFTLTPAQPGQPLGRVIQLGGIRPTITPATQNIPYSLVAFSKNVALCWAGGLGVWRGLFVRTLPFQILGLAA